MDLDLREAILNNIKQNDQEQFEATIVDAIQTGEESVLPGLGYLFELIWKESNQEVKSTMLQLLEAGVQHAVSEQS